MKYFSSVLYKIAAELSEGKKNYLLIQKWLQELSEEEQNQFIKWFEQTDPTPKGKYLEFLIKIFKEADSEQRKRYLKEDSAQIKKDLTQFEQLKQQNKIPTAEKNPQSLEELYQTVEKYSTVKSRRQEEKEIKQQGVELILNHPPYKVYKVTSADACPLMAAGSKWCVSQIYHAESYLKDGPLYFITKDNQKHALFHYEASQFMNVFDLPLEKEEMWKLFQLLEPVTGKNIEQHLKKNPIFYFNYVAAVGVNQFSKEELEIIKDYPFELVQVKEAVIAAIKEILETIWAEEQILPEKNMIKITGEFFNQESILITPQKICLQADDPNLQYALPGVAEEINQKFQQSKKLKQVQFNVTQAATGLVCVPTPKELLAPNPFKTKAYTLLQKIYQKLIKH